jgi:hypothetical protein
MTNPSLERTDPVGTVAAPSHAETLPAHDLRALGLGSAAQSLGILVADLGPLQVRRAQADLVNCPVCPGHQVRVSTVPELVPGT